MSKINYDMGGDRINIDAGGSINLKAGATITVDAAQLPALTAQLTTITPADAAGVADYAIAAVTQTTPYGFSNAAEAITVLYVIRNLQVRLAEVEARLESLGMVIPN